MEWIDIIGLILLVSLIICISALVWLYGTGRDAYSQWVDEVTSTTLEDIERGEQ